MEVSDKIKRKMDIIKMILTQNGLLNEADEINLQLLEDEFMVYEMCNEDIAKNGITIKDNKGSMKISPAASLRNKSANTILNILKEYCISSKSRKLLLLKEGEGNEEDTPLSNYMKTII